MVVACASLVASCALLWAKYLYQRKLLAVGSFCGERSVSSFSFDSPTILPWVLIHIVFAVCLEEVVVSLSGDVVLRVDEFC